MSSPQQSIPDGRTEPLADLRQLISFRPEVLYLDGLELVRLLGCSEYEAEQARQWIAEDGLEVAA